MARKSHRIRVKMKENMAEVKLLVRHPMENGRRRDQITGEKIPRHYIRELNCEHNGEPVLAAQWSWGVASNPFLSFRILDAKPGDSVRVSWVDNKGIKDSVEASIK